MSNRIVSFIEDEKLIAAVKKVVEKARAASLRTDLDKNKLDAFSALYESIILNIDYEKWIENERGRQIQKTMQNAVGDFHQEIIGGIDGWENLGTGHLIDVRNKDERIIAEVKNKHNTTKGNHLIELYDVLEAALQTPEHRGFTAYYVTMISKRKEPICLFMPSDAKLKKRRPGNSKILEISGVAFYEQITKTPNALFQIFRAIPKVLEENFGMRVGKFKETSSLEAIFYRTYARKTDFES